MKEWSLEYTSFINARVGPSLQLITLGFLMISGRN